MTTRSLAVYIAISFCTLAFGPSEQSSVAQPRQGAAAPVQVGHVKPIGTMRDLMVISHEEDGSNRFQYYGRCSVGGEIVFQKEERYSCELSNEGSSKQSAMNEKNRLACECAKVLIAELKNEITESKEKVRLKLSASEKNLEFSNLQEFFNIQSKHGISLQVKSNGRNNIVIKLASPRNQPTLQVLKIKFNGTNSTNEYKLDPTIVTFKFDVSGEKATYKAGICNLKPGEAIDKAASRCLTPSTQDENSAQLLVFGARTS